MAPSHSFLVLFLTFVFYFSSLARAAPWIVTRYYEPEVYSDDGYTITPTVTTDIVEVTPTASSMPAALSTTTVTRTYFDDIITVVQVLLPSGAPVATDNGLYNDNDYITTNYYVDLVYTAPTGCSSHWTTTTAVSLYVPSEIQGFVQPTSTSISYSVDNYKPFQPTTITQAIAWIDPTQLPASSLSFLRNLYAPVTILYVAGCPYDIDSFDGDDTNDGTSSDSGSSGSGTSYNTGSYSGDASSDDGDKNWIYDDYWYGISPLAVILIVILSWFGLWFIIGLMESWFQFQRLMTGWQARRGLPLSWAMLAPVLSCFLLCFSHKGYRARTAEEAAELQKKWTEMGGREKFALWLRWGFRWKYPPMLGPAPEKVRRRSKKPVPGPAGAAPPLLQVSPPRSSVASSNNPPSTLSGALEDAPVQREMSQLQSQSQLQPQAFLQVPTPTTRAAPQESSPAKPPPSPPPEAHAPATTPHPANQQEQDDEITVIPTSRYQQNK